MFFWIEKTKTKDIHQITVIQKIIQLEGLKNQPGEYCAVTLALLWIIISVAGILWGNQEVSSDNMLIFIILYCLFASIFFAYRAITIYIKIKKKEKELEIITNWLWNL